MKGRRGNYKRRTKGRKKFSSSRGFWLYEHWFDDKSVYVGLTARSVELRLEEHFESAREGSNTLFHKKLREENFKINTEKTLYQSEREMAKAEIDTIAKFKQQEGITVLNLTKGGEVATGKYRYDKNGVLVFKKKKTTKRWRGKYGH